MEVIKKHWITYTIELIIAIIFMSIGLEAFLVYAFIALIIALDRKVDYLRKLNRVLWLKSEAKIIALVEKQKISDSEIEKIVNDMREGLTKKQIKELEKDIRDIQGF